MRFRPFRNVPFESERWRDRGREGERGRSHKLDTFSPPLPGFFSSSPSAYAHSLCIISFFFCPLSFYSLTVFFFLSTSHSTPLFPLYI